MLCIGVRWLCGVRLVLLMLLFRDPDMAEAVIADRRPDVSAAPDAQGAITK